jgi:hypothetical protein
MKKTNKQKKPQKSSTQQLARREATMHARSFKVSVLPSFDELQT